MLAPSTGLVCPGLPQGGISSTRIEEVCINTPLPKLDALEATAL